MNLRLHPCSVTPAETRRAGQTAPPAEGLSCNNAAWLAAEAWFLCDDAFISFRYVRNLIEGHGLVFNPGERVEGYTNFPWVLELAALWGALGLRPEHAAPWLSVACTAATIGVVLWWVIRIPGLQQRRLISWVALGLLCSRALLHESELARTDPGPQFLHRPMRCDIGLPSPVI